MYIVFNTVASIQLNVVLLGGVDVDVAEVAAEAGLGILTVASKRCTAWRG